MRLSNTEALQAQVALGKLMEMDLPIKTSLDIALISNTVDSRVKAFGVVRDRLFKTYSIKAEPGDTPGTVKFTCTYTGADEAQTQKQRSINLETFSEKINELLEANTEDMSFKKIQLPKDISIKGSVLKALTEFVEVG